jgi:hypothetical protein
VPEWLGAVVLNGHYQLHLHSPSRHPPDCRT